MPSYPTYKCPICCAKLSRVNGSYQCENRHNFDIAKEGYVNLVPVQNKKSKQPGDSDAMLKSRQRFLDAGYYSRLRSCIHERIAAASAGSTFIDIGCGDGYYSEGLNLMFSSTSACDIAKTAVRLSAKRLPNTQCSVASAYSLPYFNHSFSYGLSVFSPICEHEFRRVLQEGGRILVVGPGDTHLQQLAAQIYTEVTPHRGNFAVIENSGLWTETWRQELRYSITVQNTEIEDLLKMTPYYWSAAKEKQMALAEMTMLETMVHFEIREFRVS